MKELFEQFENAKNEKDGVEFWYARGLQKLLGYTEWRNFENVIQKGKESCRNSGQSTLDHFVDVNKTIKAPKTALIEIDDVVLTRYACYLIAQNGDPKKLEIAFAQTYFAMQTRKMELIRERLEDLERLDARNKLKEAEKRLAEVVYERGFKSEDFAYLRSKGDEALFDGYATKAMKKKLGVPDKEPLADYADTVIVKGKEFAAAITAHNTKKRNLNGVEPITSEHVINNKEVRKTLLARGIVPEELPPQRDIKQIEIEIKRETKKYVDKISKWEAELNTVKGDPNPILMLDIRKELWKIALLIMYSRADGCITTNELMDEVPKYIEIPKKYQEISDSKKEPKYKQVIRNLKSNQKNQSSFVTKGYAITINNGFKITDKGIEFVKQEFAKYLF